MCQTLSLHPRTKQTKSFGPRSLRSEEDTSRGDRPHTGNKVQKLKLYSVLGFGQKRKCSMMRAIGSTGRGGRREPREEGSKRAKLEKMVAEKCPPDLAV